MIFHFLLPVVLISQGNLLVADVIEIPFVERKCCYFDSRSVPTVCLKAWDPHAKTTQAEWKR